MKYTLLLLAISFAVLSSCTSAYQSGQTPDDVYYSEASPRDEYVRSNNNAKKYRYDDEYYDDRYLRMKVSNRNRWNDLDAWYNYDRYGYRYNYYYGSWNNPYNSWNYYYNPYCPSSNIVVVNPKQVTDNNNIVKPRNFNLTSYTNNNYNNANSNLKIFTKNGIVTRPVNDNSNYDNRYNNNNSWLGNTIKDIFSGSNSSSNQGRTYNPTNSSGSSSSGNSSSGSSGSTTRPNRGGN